MSESLILSHLSEAFELPAGCLKWTLNFSKAQICYDYSIDPASSLFKHLDDYLLSMLFFLILQRRSEISQKYSFLKVLLKFRAIPIYGIYETETKMHDFLLFE